MNDNGIVSDKIASFLSARSSLKSSEGQLVHVDYFGVENYFSAAVKGVEHILILKQKLFIVFGNIFHQHFCAFFPSEKRNIHHDNPVVGVNAVFGHSETAAVKAVGKSVVMFFDVGKADSFLMTCGGKKTGAEIDIIKLAESAVDDDIGVKIENSVNAFGQKFGGVQPVICFL